MATTKRERQKAARRQKMEQMEREAKRRKNLRRAVIVAIVAVLVIGSAALLFSGKSTPTTTSTASTTTTTVATTTTTPVKRTAVTDPSPAGKFGTAPTVNVPPGAPPTSFEVSDLIAGTGAAVKTGDKLTMQYVLATYSSRKVIQSSWTSQPFSLTLGVTSLIPGWDQGLLGMRVGGRREMIIPPSLGYGTHPPGAGISKNDTLVFVVDLLKIG
jgi:peptidylprolyl isomerase